MDIGAAPRTTVYLLRALFLHTIRGQVFGVESILLGKKSMYRCGGGRERWSSMVIDMTYKTVSV